MLQYIHIMRIGINASFLRKPATGIGQVTLHFLKTLSELSEAKAHTFVLYLDEEVGTCNWPANFEQRIFLPWWKRDDVPRKLLWERNLSRRAQEDGCQAFISLSQSATIFSKNFPHIMVVHDLIPEIFPEYRRKITQRLHWRNISKAIKTAKKIIAVSQSTKKDLVRLFGISEDRIDVASPSVDPIFHEDLSSAAVRKVLEKYNLQPGYIYHGGGLELRKNTAVACEAYAILKGREMRKDLRTSLPPLVISGKIHTTSNKLATDIVAWEQKLSSIGADVRLLDFVPQNDLPALYKGALFFVYPSSYEGFGMPVLEALSVGVPTIVSRNSSLPEVGGEAVKYYEPYFDAVWLAKKMENLLLDNTLREDLISKSRHQALQFNWKNFTETVYASLITSL